ncbi:MAG: ribosome biogenesis GTPase Der [Candidatus Tectomicrobia bacterium]|uniref:GTPase Der n=1 Tax=Tectimicrobiota bacterium TaxID=2528274 RepID=A0A932I3H4_UNCTE|nr:ribosome biogenesis GTPase Der [Candidatus Tectomicrobia bacterium]
MPLPTLVIVGRPNVGKSTLFNRLVRRREAIVRPEPGVTRDRHYGRAEWEDRAFLAVDTGGMASGKEDDPFDPLIERQARSAIEEGDVVLFLVDGIEGLLPGDVQIAQMVREAGRPVLLVLNKADAARSREAAWDFYRLGLGEPLPVSAEHGTGVPEMVEAVLARLPPEAPEEEAAGAGEIRVAVVGRPNVGKSSFINRLLGEERTLVSPVPGTTRDPIDTLCRRGDALYRFIDTAGIRRRGKIGDLKIEAVSMILAYRSIERADAVILLLDAAEGATSMDAQIARHIVDSGKACAILLNKWDLVEKDSRTFDETAQDIRDRLVHVDFAPILSVSALTGQRCERVFDLIGRLGAAHRRRVPTAALNQRVREWTQAHPAPSGKGGKRPKFLYATQASVAPPHVVLFTSQVSTIPTVQYGRYIENRLREAFDFEGTPIRVSFRSRREKAAPRRRGKGRKKDGKP